MIGKSPYLPNKYDLVEQEHYAHQGMTNTVTNTNNLSLRSILEKDKLTGPNFLDWERNLMIVLRHERKWYVLEKASRRGPSSKCNGCCQERS
ncbi:hypothetical protein OSB04_032061 [Centaurea solstitialis]|uniref:Uncharacterized protein n=1 Tax=Centaurea solstitialis TaxID=347529 RepID=A0AA38SI81_9ASTR|nr:hypothetical protein OSB04_032061 [Centaurea solstitialis]